MNKFKVGDMVRLVGLESGLAIDLRRQLDSVATVVGNGDERGNYRIRWSDNTESVSGRGGFNGTLTLVLEDNKNLKENDMTTQKFYRLRKDTPAIVAGAILRNTCDTYEPISDVWEVFPDRPKSAWGEWIVEHATDWYERVYEVQVNGQTKYLLQADARAAVEANLSDTTPAS